MKGYITVEIPTKKYIKAYLISRFGGKVVMSPDNKFGNKLYDVLEHSTNERATEFSNSRYDAKLRIYISMHTFKKRGCHLNETNIKNFNSFVEDDLKDKFYFLMDFYIEILPVYSAHVDDVRKKLGIDIEAWSDDSMKKDYYRYRKSMGFALLYDKNSSRTVLSEKPAHIVF